MYAFKLVYNRINKAKLKIGIGNS